MARLIIYRTEGSDTHSSKDLTCLLSCCRRWSPWPAPPGCTPAPGSRAPTQSLSASRLTQTGQWRSWRTSYKRRCICRQELLTNYLAGAKSNSKAANKGRTWLRHNQGSRFTILLLWPNCRSVQTFIDFLAIWAFQIIKSWYDLFLATCFELCPVNSYHQWGLQQENSRLEG